MLLCKKCNREYDESLMIQLSDENICLNCKEQYLMELRSGIKYRGWGNSSVIRVEELIKMKFEIYSHGQEWLSIYVDKSDNVKRSGTGTSEQNNVLRQTKIKGLFTELKSLLTNESIEQPMSYKSDGDNLLHYRFMFFKYERNPLLIEFFLSHPMDREISGFAVFAALLTKVQEKTHDWYFGY